jgi:hypothetical protein
MLVHAGSVKSSRKEIMMLDKRMLVCLGICLFLVSFLAYAGEGVIRKPAVEKLLVNADPERWILSSLQLSPDGKRAAYIERAGEIKPKVVEKKKSKVEDEKEEPKTIYEKFLVLDGKRGKKYENIGLGKSLFSPDGLRYAYAVLVEEKRFMVIDGKEQKEYDQLGKRGVVFSPDSKHTVYAATTGKRWYAVVDEKEVGEYNSVGDSSFTFSPDSAHLAYAVVVKKLFSSYCCIVVDGKEGKQYKGLGEGSPQYSPDGKRIAYIAMVTKKGKPKWCVVVDGEEGEFYDEIKGGSIIFSPDSKHVAYLASIHAENKENLEEKFRDKTNDKYFVVNDGKEGKQYSGIVNGTLVFSPDGNHLAYIARSGGYFLIVDEKEKASFAISATIKPLYNPVTGKLLCVVRDKNKYFLVQDGKEGKRYHGISPTSIVFSDDGRHIAFTAMSGDKQFVVLDDTEGRKYDVILPVFGSKITFDSPGSIWYNALGDDKTKVYLVRETFEEVKE